MHDARVWEGVEHEGAWDATLGKGGERQEDGGQSGQHVRRAAALTAELAGSRKRVSVVRDHPPGLRDEPATPDNVTPLATSSPLSLAPTSLLPASSNLLPADRLLQPHRKIPRNSTTDSHACPRTCGPCRRETEFLRESNWQGRGLDATTAHEQEA